jgi:septal ring factor EnvC (AmiA/AmiB activator)
VTVTPRLALVALLLAGWPAAAQDAAAPANTPDELEKLQGEIDAAQKKRDEDEAARERAAIELDALKHEASTIAAAIQQLERDFSEADQRIVELSAQDLELTESLAARHDRIAPLMGALQRLRRDPPPALAVSPEDAVAAARGAMLIASVAAQLEMEARALSADLKALSETRLALTAERDATLTREAQMSARRTELAVLIEKRQQAVSQLADGVTGAESRIAELEARAADMTDLMDWLDGVTSTPATAATESATAPVVVESAAARKESFTARKGQIRWPAAGTLSTRFGETSPDGIVNHGVGLKTRPSAVVTAPADGEIVFAGPFGDYGQLLILAPADGYFILIGGFGRLDAISGQHVLSGEPLGSMAGTGTSGQGLMYIEFRRDGSPVDPVQWFEPAAASG